MLFDLGSTYFYVSISFPSDFEMLCDVLDTSIHISTPVGESIIITRVYRAFLILFM